MVVDGLLTNYTKAGKNKKCLVLLHGWGDSVATYARLSKKLADDYTVVAIDLPGFGGTQIPEGVWGLEDYAAFVAAFLKKADISSVYAFVAHSNGGAVAIKGLASGTLKANRLVLLASAGIRTLQKGRRMAVKMVAKAGKAATFWLPTHHKQTLQKKLYGTVGSDMLVVPSLQETFKKTVRQDVQADARQLKLPVLLIYGEDDQATPVMYGEMYHQLIGGSTLEVISGAGHFVHHDKPDQVTHAIERFLK